MSKYAISLIISLQIMASAVAQTVVSSIDYIGVYDLQTQLVGDSILISYWSDALQGQRANQSPRKLITSIIDHNGNIFDFDFKELRDEALVTVINSSDSIIFYYFTKKKFSTLNSLSVNRNTLNKKTHNEIVSIKGTPLAVVREEKNLYLLSLLSDTREIKITLIRNSSVLGEKIFSVDINPRILKSRASVIYENVLVHPSEAKPSLKIYKTDDDFLLSVEFESGSTHIYRLNFKTGNVSKETFGGLAGDFGTFIYRNYFFRLEKNQGFTLNIYDLKDNRLLKTIFLDKKNPINKEMAYLRDDVANVVLTNRNVWDAMDNTGSTFLSVYQVDPTDFVIKLGTHKKIKDVPIGPLAVPGFALLVGALSAVDKITPIYNANNVDHYYYLKGNILKGFTYSDGAGLVDQKIDRFELDIRPDVKAYLSWKSSTFAIYNFEGTMRVVRFDR